MLLENSWGTLCPIPRWSSEVRQAYRFLHDRIVYQLTTELDDLTRYMLCDITHLATLSGLNTRTDLLLPYGIPNTPLGQTEYSFQDYIEGESGTRAQTVRWIAEHSREPTQTSLISLSGLIDSKLTLVPGISPNTKVVFLLRLFAVHDHRRLFYPDVTEKGYNDYAMNLSNLHHFCTGKQKLSLRKITRDIHAGIRRECLADIDPITRWNRCVGMSYLLLHVLYLYRIEQLYTPNQLSVISRLRDFLLYLTKDLPHV